MSESAGMTLISTIIQTLSTFNSTNVSIGEWGVLNSGKSRHYAIIRPGTATRPRAGFGVRQNNYNTVVEVWNRHKNDGETMTGLLTLVDSITAKIDQYSKLGDATGTVIKNAEANQLSDVFERWREHGDGSSWLSRDIAISWTEESKTTYAE